MLEVLFYLLDGSEDFVHDLGDDGVAVGFEGFISPFCERNGSSVHPNGKPIISPVYWGLSRQPRSFFPFPSTAARNSTIFATASSKFDFCRLDNFGLNRSQLFT